MNNQEAKLILQAYRPGGQDASDPLFADALEQARRDPELQKWFAEEQAFDTHMQARLQKAIEIPVDLKASLLAQRKAVRPKVWWWQSLRLTAATALVVLLAALAVVWLKPAGPPPFAGLRELAVKNSRPAADHVSFMVQDEAKIKDWLKAQNVATDFNLPGALRASVPHGCKVLDWRGHKVTMLCLMPGGSHVDLFVIDGTHFRDFQPTETAQFAKADGVTTAVWCNGDKTYVLAGNLDEQQLRKIL